MTNRWNRKFRLLQYNVTSAFENIRKKVFDLLLKLQSVHFSNF